MGTLNRVSLVPKNRTRFTPTVLTTSSFADLTSAYGVKGFPQGLNTKVYLCSPLCRGTFPLPYRHYLQGVLLKIPP